MMTATAPAENKPWADTPIKLITTPQYETKQVCDWIGDVYTQQCQRVLDPIVYRIRD